MRDLTEAELEKICQEKYSINEAEWGRLIDHNIEYMRIMLEGNSGHITPHLWVEIVGEDGERGTFLHALLVPFNEDKEKRDSLYSIGRRLYPQRKMPIAVFLISEAWMSPKSVGVQPGEHPERSEVIVIFGRSMVPERSVLVCTPVERRADNTIVTKGDPQINYHGQSPLLMEFYRGFFSEPLAKMAQEQ